jgi:pyruvate dehydrogenase E2 component (dihydrolipoamide acetyltransferase)
MAEVVTMPKLGFDMAEGSLVRWVVAEGEGVERGEVLAEIETDKATVEVESTHSGIVHHHLVKEGEVLPVGAPIAVIGEPDESFDLDELVSAAGQVSEEEAEAAPPEPEGEAPAGQAVPSPEGAQLPGGVKASPLARRMAEEHAIDLKQLQGSGPGGRVVKKDVQSFLQAEPAPGKAPSMPGFVPLGPAPEDEIVPLSKLRAAIGRRMAQAKQQVPHFYVTAEYDMGPLMAMRAQVNLMLADADEKLSVNDFIVKAVALALREFPNLNASLQDDRVVHHGQVNIGVAVAVEGGLLTVVVRDADRKPLRQISAQTAVMVQRARQGKVRPEDIEGSTFSVSNMGMFAVEHFVAIINPPEAAILAVGSVRQVPVVEDGQVKPGQRMKATISVDHRISDGAEAAQFLQALGKYLQEPLRMMV